MTESGSSSDDTCWTLVRAAADGDTDAGATFARHYARPIRSYLNRRWATSPLRREIEDAQQEVFVECIKPGGTLERANPTTGGFRALLFGVTRNVARRFEERAARQAQRQIDESIYLDALPDQAEPLSQAFDRGWAEAILREAASRHEQAARQADEDYRLRFRVLQLRHEGGRPIREVALQLGFDNADEAHNAYRRARREFRACLREVVAARTGAPASTPAETLDRECVRILEMLRS